MYLKVVMICVWNAICFKYKEVQMVYSGHETRRQFRRSRTPSSSKGLMPGSLVNSEWGKKRGGGGGACSGLFRLSFIYCVLVPSEPPPDVVVKSTSSSTIHVSWGPIRQAFVHGILMGYEVSYAKDEESSAWDNKTLDANAHETVLSDLEYFTPYKVVICARTSQGCGKNVSRNATTFGDGELKIF